VRLDEADALIGADGLLVEADHSGDDRNLEDRFLSRDEVFGVSHAELL